MATINSMKPVRFSKARVACEYSHSVLRSCQFEGKDVQLTVSWLAGNVNRKKIIKLIRKQMNADKTNPKIFFFFRSMRDQRRVSMMAPISKIPSHCQPV
jgi:hypothetical protein